MNSEQRGEIVIYQNPDGTVQTEVKLFEETLWLSLNQIAELFDRDKGVISRHIKNIFKDGELPENATVANFATVQSEGKRKITRNIEYFNLDMILSVGYRVSSKRGTQFRIWANRVLKDHLVRGYSLNEKRLKEQSEELQALKSGITLLERSVLGQTQNLEQATIEEKSAMLLYLIVKNHSFVDGNKRIAAALFLYFLDKNNLLYLSGNKLIIGNEGLAALTLMIAESKADEMETVKQVIVSILNRGQGADNK